MTIKTLTVFLLASAALAQTPDVTAVRNAASFDTRLSPGCNAALFGTNLGPTAGTANPPGYTVTVNNRPAPVVFGSAAQVNIQIPVELAAGPATLILEYQGRRSQPIAFQLTTHSPGLLALGAAGVGAGIFLRTNGSIVMPQNPANPGEFVSLFAFGLGPTNPLVATGVPPPTAPPARTVTLPRVNVGGRSATVTFSGLSGSLGPSSQIGFYQVNFIVPGDLNPGTYPVTLEIAGFTSNTVTLPVAITGIVPTQSGFTLNAIQGGSTPPPQTFRLLNGTGRVLNYTITPSTVSGGSWLSATPAAGSTDPAQAAPAINVNVNASALTPGDYYGQLRIDAPGAANTPQFLAVVINVVGANVNPGPVIDPTGLVFVGLLGAAPPAAQAVRITNLTNTASPFTATGSVVGTVNWFTVSPASGSVAPGQPASVQVQFLAGLAAGVYRGSLTLVVGGTSRVVDLLGVVTPRILGAEEELLLRMSGRSADGDCTATRLLPVATLLGTGFTTAAAWPTPLEALVIDDCGTPMRTGSVVASFSNNDPPLTLTPQQDGRWSGTWAPRNARTGITITLTAEQADRRLTGTAQIGGAAQDNPEVPQVNQRGVVSAASYSTTAIPSPGELVAIFGRKLADRFEEAADLPLPTTMSGATLTLGGRLLPLRFTSEGQVNGVIPYDLTPGTTYQLIARRGNRLSVPEPVTVSAAEPAIFSTDLTGTGQGHIYVFPTPTEQILADAARPARAGEFLVLYCAGLGQVTPAIAAGARVPTDVLRPTASALTVTIGGVTARVDFAGLTPGFTGLYQVNTVVPAGVTPGDQVPVVLTVAGNSSPVVTMAVR